MASSNMQRVTKNVAKAIFLSDENDTSGVDDAKYNGFSAEWALVCERLRKPVRELTFWLYLIVAVAGFGGLAIWIEWWRYLHEVPQPPLSNLRLALATVFPAVLGASALELILGENKLLRGIGIAFLAFFLVLAFYILGFGDMSDEKAIFLGAVGCLGGILVWWISNGLDELFQDRVDPSNASGGDPRRPLSRQATKIKI